MACQYTGKRVGEANRPDAKIPAPPTPPKLVRHPLTPSICLPRSELHGRRQQLSRAHGWYSTISPQVFIWLIFSTRYFMNFNYEMDSEQKLCIWIYGSNSFSKTPHQRRRNRAMTRNTVIFLLIEMEKRKRMHGGFGAWSLEIRWRRQKGRSAPC